MQKKFSFIAGFAAGALIFGATGALATVGVTAVPTTSKIYVDGYEMTAIEAYNVNGSNYFKLRDTGRIGNFAVDYNAADNAVIIDTTRPYAVGVRPELLAPPTATPAPAAVYPAANPPIIGSTPAKIIVENPDPKLLGGANFTEPYKYGGIGQCVWYALGRFYEVHGIPTHTRFLGSPKSWPETIPGFDDVELLTDIKSVPALSVAVYIPREGDSPGHVRFIEYVEYANGRPVSVYSTEANGINTLNYDRYDPGYDCTVQVTEYEKFIADENLIGYMIPKR
jgi:hypothetical protein